MRFFNKLFRKDKTIDHQDIINKLEKVIHNISLQGKSTTKMGISNIVLEAKIVRKQ